MPALFVSFLQGPLRKDRHASELITWHNPGSPVSLGYILFLVYSSITPEKLLENDLA